MKNNILMLLVCLNTLCFAQVVDSTAIKNQKLIADLRNRISVIENKNNSNNHFEEIEVLKRKERRQQDSIIALNEIIRKFNEKNLTEKYSHNKAVDVNELNNDLKNNSFVLSELGNCNCVRLYYNSYQTEIDYSRFKELDSIANICINNSNSKLKLIGHADKSGSEAINISLSKNRVNSLKNYLVTVKKIPAKNISIEWHGSAIPVKDAVKIEHQFLNRRTEVFLSL